MARFVRQRAGEEFAVAWWFYYDNSDHLWACVEGHGDYNSGSAVMSDCVYDSAAEYRYDGGRARYLVRPRDPTTLDLLDPETEGAAAVGAWRDFDGETIYRDYGVALDSEGASPAEQTAITDGRAFLAGVGYLEAPGFPGPLAPEISLEARYEHSDQIGTVRAISGDDESDPPGPAEMIAGSEYTAFGEEIQASYPNFDVNQFSRYGYAGAHGYEHSTHYAPFASYSWKDPLDDLGWLHVGHRYYDPSSGRFMQRDPIGIEGGLNCYSYASSNPVASLDVDGLQVYEPPEPPPGPTGPGEVFRIGPPVGPYPIRPSDRYNGGRPFKLRVNPPPTRGPGLLGRIFSNCAGAARAVGNTIKGIGDFFKAIPPVFIPNNIINPIDPTDPNWANSHMVQLDLHSNSRSEQLPDEGSNVVTVTALGPHRCGFSAQA